MSLAANGPVFVGGVNRSGTSLVRQILGSHPDLAMPPSEFEFFKRLTLPVSAALRGDQIERLVDDVLRWPKVAGWQVDPELVRRHALADRSPRGLFTAFLRAYAEKLDKPRFGEKTTYYERRLTTFDRWFPGNYSFVHVLRQPVATFASNRWYEGTEHRVDARAWALDWCSSALIAIRALRARRGYIAVRYEDLVRDPERETRRMCETADLSFAARMLAMADFVQKENSSFEVGPATYVGAVRTSDQVDRASRIPDHELAVVKSQCRAVAALIGYDVDDERRLLPLGVAHGAALEWRARASVTARSGAQLATRLPGRLRAFAGH
jgi:hypothetical protein